MTAVFCHNANDRKAATWQQQLTPFKNLEFVISDAAKGIATALQQTAQLRRGATPWRPLWATGWISSIRLKRLNEC